MDIGGLQKRPSPQGAGSVFGIRFGGRGCYAARTEVQGHYFFFEAFFLPFFFALAMLALQFRVSPGPEYIHENQKNKQPRSVTRASSRTSCGAAMSSGTC